MSSHLSCSESCFFKQIHSLTDDALLKQLDSGNNLLYTCDCFTIELDNDVPSCDENSQQKLLRTEIAYVRKRMENNIELQSRFMLHLIDWNENVDVYAALGLEAVCLSCSPRDISDCITRLPTVKSIFLTYLDDVFEWDGFFDSSDLFDLLPSYTIKCLDAAEMYVVSCLADINAICSATSDQNILGIVTTLQLNENTSDLFPTLEENVESNHLDWMLDSLERQKQSLNLKSLHLNSFNVDDEKKMKRLARFITTDRLDMDFAENCDAVSTSTFARNYGRFVSNLLGKDQLLKQIKMNLNSKTILLGFLQTADLHSLPSLTISMSEAFLQQGISKTVEDELGEQMKMSGFIETISLIFNVNKVKSFSIATFHLMVSHFDTKNLSLEIDCTYINKVLDSLPSNIKQTKSSMIRKVKIQNFSVENLTLNVKFSRPGDLAIQSTKLQYLFPNVKNVTYNYV